MISPPRVALLEGCAGPSAASWDITISPKLCACVPSTRLWCERSVLNLGKTGDWRLPGRPRHDIRDRRDSRGASSEVFNLAAPGLLEQLLAGTFVIKRTKGDGSDEHDRRVSGQATAKRTRLVPNSYVKEQLLELAKKWRTMAAYEEKHGR